MLPDRHLNSRRYYDLLPPSTHSCGDIWQGLPSFGLLGSAPISGLVVTPACDLTQRKAETITYLPVIPVRAYFSTLAALPETHRRIKNYLKAGKFTCELAWSSDGFVPPRLDEIDGIIGSVREYIVAKQRSMSELSALQKAIVGLKIAEAIAKPDLSQIPGADLALFFGPDWPKMKERIVANSFSSHLHFMPSDDQDPIYSGISSHSLVLFRYPLTTSIEIFDLAQASTEAAWSNSIAQTATFLPAAASFRNTRPIKVLAVRPEFLHDLLSRYVAVYNRIGSPDFSRSSIDAICAQMDNS
jgi:hypothetical protein